MKVYWMAMEICLSGLLFCGCSANGKGTSDGSSGEEDRKTAVEKDAFPKGKDVALEFFSRWIQDDHMSRRGFDSSKEITPEIALGLEKPGELAPSVNAWAKSTEFGDYYRQSRASLAALYKKLIDDFNARKGSGVGETEYSRELLRSWREAYNLDYNLRKFILECYSRKEILPLPPSLARVFTAKKEAQEKLARQVKQAKAEIVRLTAEAAALNSGIESAGDVSWAQKKGAADWRALHGTIGGLVARAEKAVADADALVASFTPIVRANAGEANVREIGRNAEEVKEKLASLARSAQKRLRIANGQVVLAECADQFGQVESELASIKSAMSSAATVAWSDERDVQAWRGLYELMSGLASRAEKAKSGATALVRKVRPVLSASMNDPGVAAFAGKVERLVAELSEIVDNASGQATIAKAQPQRIECAETCAALEKELADIKSALGAMKPVSWTDENEIEVWRDRQGPAEEIDAKASGACARASALAEGVKSVVGVSKGDKIVSALDARIERLNADLCAVGKQISERLAIVKGQVPLTKFAGQCRQIADGMVKIPPAFAKKKARMAEIRSLGQLVRTSRTRDYSDLDELARRTADVKARSLAERAEEIALGQRVQKLIAVRENVMGSAALYRLRMQVPGKSAQARIEAELAAFRRAVDAASEASLPGVFVKIESKAFQLSDCTGEDAILNELEETLRIVQRLAARKR